MPGPYRAAMGKRDVAASWRAAYMRPLQIGGSLQLRGFGALGGAQRAPPASKAGPLVRLLAPQGQALLTTPVSLRSTVAPCSQPRPPSQQRQFSLRAFFCCQKKASSRGAAVPGQSLTSPVPTGYTVSASGCTRPGTHGRNSRNRRSRSTGRPRSAARRLQAAAWRSAAAFAKSTGVRSCRPVHQTCAAGDTY